MPGNQTKGVILSIEFRLDQEIFSFNQIDFVAAIEDRLGIDIRDLTVSVRNGSVIVTLEGNSEVLRKIVEHLHNSNSFGAFAEKTDLESVTWKGQGFVETLSSPLVLSKPSHKAAPERDGIGTLATWMESPFPASKLPLTGEHLVGRSKELAKLTRAWKSSKTNIVQIVAPGGVGKTQLVKKWQESLMDKGDHSGAARVYDWSFYSQGTKKQASADDFFDQTLRWFGETALEKYKDPWAKGERLAHLVKEKRTLLILDGLEPLQHPPGPLEGELSDPSLQSLIRGLVHDNPGLCVITTREAVPDLAEISELRRMTIDLNTLDDAAGAELLTRYGVYGKDKELQQAARDYEGHALALILLGTYLRDRFGGDIVQRNRVTWPPGMDEDSLPVLNTDALSKATPRFAKHARKVMLSYVNWFEHEAEAKGLSEEDPIINRAAVAILHLMGLFNRPADAGCLNALRAAPPIPNLTDALFEANDPEELWQQAVLRLRKAHLLAHTDSANLHALDAHPLIREHFAIQLDEHYAGAASEAHRRLYEHLKQSAPKMPDNLNDMMPLYHAVAHGCAGAECQGAWSVYWERMAQKNWAFTSRVAPPGISLAALSYFFEHDFESLNTEPLEPEGEARILYDTGHYLFLLGNTNQAIEPLKRALDKFEDLGAWKVATNNARILRETHLIRGELSQALRVAWRCLENADRSKKRFPMMSARAALGQVLDYIGADVVAEECFNNAEEYVKHQKDGTRRLFYIWGYWKLNFLLRKRIPSVYQNLMLGKNDITDGSQNSFDDLRKLAEDSLIFSQKKALAFNIALDHQTLGTLAFLLARNAESPELAEAKMHFDQAVSLLRPLGQRHHLASALLSRTTLWRLRFEFSSDVLELSRAKQDLAEAEEIAKQGDMLIFQIETALERTRLAIASMFQGMKDERRRMDQDMLKSAHEKLDEAKCLIKQTEKPYKAHVPNWDGWDPPDYFGVFKEGENVGYHRRNREIERLQKQIDSPE